MNTHPSKCLLRDCKGSTALEFGLVANVLMLLLMGTLELSVLLWQMGTLQSVAAQTARCAAINSTACQNAQTYAVNLAASWLGSSVITTSNVSVSTPTTCGQGSASGTFESVTISPPTWASRAVYWFVKQGVTMTACYPT